MLPQVKQTDRIGTATWPDAARCADADPFLFGAMGEDQQPTPAQRRRAARLCAVCPVREACLADARSQENPHGVWGGIWFADGKERDPATLRGPATRPDAAEYDPVALSRMSPEDRARYLAALGWRSVAIAETTGIPVRTVRRYLTGAA